MTTLARGIALARAVCTAVGENVVANPVITIGNDFETLSYVQFVTLHERAAVAAKVLAWSAKPVRIVYEREKNVEFAGESEHGVPFCVLLSPAEAAEAIVEYGVRVDEPVLAGAAS